MSRFVELASVRNFFAVEPDNCQVSKLRRICLENYSKYKFNLQCRQVFRSLFFFFFFASSFPFCWFWFCEKALVETLPIVSLNCPQFKYIMQIPLQSCRN